jgi:hypothetical protein
VQQVNKTRGGGPVFGKLGVVGPSSSSSTIGLSARARLGLTEGAEEPEIVAKLGSMGEYLSILSRLELKK